MFDVLPPLFFAGLLAYAAYSDITTMTIPNWVSIALAALAPAFALLAGAPLAQIGLHLAVGFVLLLLGFMLFQFNVFGGGDAKLLAAGAVWTGLGALYPFLLWTTIAGGLLSLSILVARRGLKPAEGRPAFVNKLLTREVGVPYGVAILIGGLAAMPALTITSSH